MNSLPLIIAVRKMFPTASVIINYEKPLWVQLKPLPTYMHALEGPDPVPFL